MRKLIISIVCCAGFTQAFCQNIETCFRIGWNYLDTSKVVRKELLNFVAEEDQKMLKKYRQINYPCPRISFIDLSESKSTFLDSAKAWGLRTDELLDLKLNVQNNGFTSFESPVLTSIGYKKNRNYFFSSFSKLNGRVLPVMIRYNSSSLREPCVNLISADFEQFLMVYLIFNKKFTKVEKVLFSTFSN